MKAHRGARAALGLLGALASLPSFRTLPLSHAEATAPVIAAVSPNGAPGAGARKNEPEVARDWWVKNVHHPSLTAFLPPRGKASGAAVVVAPGGGFRELVLDAEGKQPGEYSRQLGAAAFALNTACRATPTPPTRARRARGPLPRGSPFRRAAIGWAWSPTRPASETRLPETRSIASTGGQTFRCSSILATSCPT
jgi:hypothetical protein